MSYRTLRVAISAAGIGTVTLSRPNSRNAIDPEAMADLGHALEEAEQTPALRALVLRAEGPVFCAGGHLDWLRSGQDLTSEENIAEAHQLVQLLARLNEFPVPVICAVQGAAIGGGVGLVSVADLAVASTEAVFGLGEARLGLVPSCVAPFVVEKIGLSWARRYLVVSERFSAAQALAMGLIHEVVTEPAQLDAAVERIVEAVRKSAPGATRVIKRYLRTLQATRAHQGNGAGLEEAARAFAASRVSEEGLEGLQALFEKREPRWALSGPRTDFL